LQDCLNRKPAGRPVAVARPAAPTENPIEDPTITKPEDDLYTIIAIRVDVFGLPDDVPMRELKNEMKSILEGILLQLAENLSWLEVLHVEESNRNLLRRLLPQKDVSRYFDVYVDRNEYTYGPLVINEIRGSYKEMLDEVM
jgi:hypothetical protein